MELERRFGVCRHLTTYKAEAVQRARFRILPFKCKEDVA